jgi:hypothetical protein
MADVSEELIASIIHHPDDEGSQFLWKVCRCLVYHTILCNIPEDNHLHSRRHNTGVEELSGVKRMTTCISLTFYSPVVTVRTTVTLHFVCMRFYDSLNKQQLFP